MRSPALFLVGISRRIFGWGLLFTPFLLQAETPKIAVIFEEKVQGLFGLSGSWTDTGQAERVLLQEMEKGGLKPLDSATVKATLLRDQAIQALGGDSQAAVAAAARLQARIVITGNGFAKSGGAIAGSSMKSIQANVQAKAIDAQTGQTLASATAAATKVHVDEMIGGGQALEEAGTKVASELITQLKQALAAAESGPKEVEIQLSGLTSYRHFLFLKQWMRHNLKGYQDISSENYTVGSATLVVKSDVEGSQVAEQLALAKFDGFAVNPVDVSPVKVSAKVILTD